MTDRTVEELEAHIAMLNEQLAAARAKQAASPIEMPVMQLPPRGPSLLAKVHAIGKTLNASVHPWQNQLARVAGTIDYNGTERVSTQQLLDILEIPQSKRTTATYRVLARLMAQQGWTAVRVIDRTGRRSQQVRGFQRNIQERRA
jgi:hypothetical protein